MERLKPGTKIILRDDVNELRKENYLNIIYAFPLDKELTVQEFAGAIHNCDFYRVTGCTVKSEYLRYYSKEININKLLIPVTAIIIIN